MTGPIKLRIPHQPPYHGVALLVVGGVAARLDLPYSQLEDLQLALESVLENVSYARGAEVSVEVEIDGDTLALLVGPLDAAALGPDLVDDRDDRVPLGRLLHTLVEEVRLEDRADGGWLRLKNRIEPSTTEESEEGG